jgi:hypothetical protein
MTTALLNNRWEAVAQGIAKGMSQAQAYLDAGYTPDPKNASRIAHKLLKQHPEILVRADDLQRQFVNRHAQANEQALVTMALDRETVLADAATNLDIALGRKKVRFTRTRAVTLGEGGDAQIDVLTADYMAYNRDGMVAARMIEMIGRELGLFSTTPKSQPDPLDDLSPEQLVAGVQILKDVLALRKEEDARQANGGAGPDGDDSGAN